MKMSTHATTKTAAPLYNTPKLSHLQPTLLKDSQGLIKEIEIVALPHTKLTLLEQISPTVYAVATADYPASPLYVDSRFLEPAEAKTPERKKKLPSAQSILQSLQSLVGVRYFWGGNWADGIPEMIQFYPHLAPSESLDDIICKGVDCSGLLYQATHGFTPRNTSELCKYGEEISADLSSPAAVQRIVQPLDMMVWKGHVLFVLDSEHWIESAAGLGVTISNFNDRYLHFYHKLQNENKPFTLRRWYPHAS